MKLQTYIFGGKYYLEHFISKGAFGDVYQGIFFYKLAVELPSRNKVAIKFVILDLI